MKDIPQNIEEIGGNLMSLPQSVRQAIFSVNAKKIVEDIVTELNLHIDKGGILLRETYAYLGGMQDHEEYAESLKDTLELSEEDYRKLLGLLNERLFVPIRNHIQEELEMEDILREAEKLSDENELLKSKIDNISSDTKQYGREDILSGVENPPAGESAFKSITEQKLLGSHGGVQNETTYSELSPEKKLQEIKRDPYLENPEL